MPGEISDTFDPKELAHLNLKITIDYFSKKKLNLNKLLEKIF